jgi:hypothetical protein
MLLQDVPNGRETQIEQKWRDTDWVRVWNYLWETLVADIKGEWYKVLHDILPTKGILHFIRLSPTDLCSDCNVPETLPHRMAACGAGAQQWAWIKQLSLILRTDPRLIPEEWQYMPVPSRASAT